MQMFNPNPNPEDVAKAKEALKVSPVLLSTYWTCYSTGLWQQPRSC